VVAQTELKGRSRRMAERPTISIDIVSDVVCPWCYIGQKRMRKALLAVPEIDVEIRWRPYQLDPTIPPQGRDRREYMLAKFGSEARLRDMHARIVPLGEAVGIDFDFEAITVSPNTLDVHRVIRWAQNAGDGVQDRLVQRLFSGYFELGENIGDHHILVEAARLSGMDPTIVQALLPTDADRDTVAEEVSTASRMGITGVPCFLLEGKYAVMGAQDADVLADAIRQVAAEKVNSTVAST
jgi:predicted DsbA family dithiol-disulfide isomerase